MRLTPRRWLLIAVLGGALCAALALPDWNAMMDRGMSGRFYFGDYGRWPALARQQRAAQANVDRLRAEAAREFVRRTLATSATTHDTALLTWIPAPPVGDSGAPRRVRANARLLADSARRLRSRAGLTAEPAVRIVMMRLPDVVNGLVQPLKEDHWRLGWIVLPDSLGGRTCTIAYRDPALLGSRWRGENPAGACFWYAAFGIPGRGMREELERQSYSSLWRAGLFSSQSDSAAERDFALRSPPRVVDELMLMLWLDGTWGLTELVCLAHGGPACSEGGWNDYGGWYRHDPGVRAATLVWATGGGWPTPLSIPRVATDLGPERFARLWRSELPFQEAFASVAGESFNDYVRRNTFKYYHARYHPGPWPSGGALALVALIATLCLAAMFAGDRRPSVA